MFGLYEFIVMPFGPATFNRMMECIFCKHCTYTGVIFDDIIIYSKTLEEHKSHLKAILQELRDNKLFINGKKSEFILQEIQYLGHIFSKSGIRMDPENLKIIEEWIQPRNLHELRIFIGMCSYYRRIIEKFSILAGPLHDFTKKNIKYQWTAKENESFKKLMTKRVFVLPNLMKPFEVNCDASSECLGAMILQEGHAIAYESICFHPQERVLGIYEKELLAVMHALDSWKHYVLGNPFIIRMDHQNLKYFMTQTKISDKQMRWTNFISQFHFHIAHIIGKQNVVADALSRRPRVNAVSIAYHNDLSSMIDAYASDIDFANAISALAIGKTQDPYILKYGFLLYELRLCVTQALREKVMNESHAPPYAGHRGIQATTSAI